MTRGNQREIDRARAAARAAKGRKEGNEGDPKLRAERYVVSGKDQGKGRTSVSGGKIHHQ